MNGNARTPAERIIARFGVERLSRWTGRHRSRVHAWAWPRAKGGTAGAIPLSVRPAIIDGAATAGDPIQPPDFEPIAGEVYLTDGIQ